MVIRPPPDDGGAGVIQTRGKKTSVLTNLGHNRSFLVLHPIF